MFKFINKILCLTLVFAVCGCKKETKLTVEGGFNCGEAYINVKQNEDKTITLRFEGDDIVLNNVASESGAKYESTTEPQMVFWSDGGVAYFIIGDNEYPECTTVVKPDLGTIYSIEVLGNEPNWNMKLDGNEITALTLPEGEIETPILLEDINTFDDYRVYSHIGHDDASLAVTVYGVGCQDTMSGQNFPYTVGLTLNGTQYRGCAK